MTNSKLHKLLLSLDGHMRKRFRKYLHSPYFNESAELTALYNAWEPMLKKGPQASERGRQKKQLWLAVHPTASYNDLQFRRLCSDLNKQLEQFLVHEELRENSAQRQVQLLEKFNQPELDKHFKAALRQVRLAEERSSLRNSDYHYMKYLTETCCHTHIEKLGNKRQDFENLEKADYHLDCFYHIHKLKNYCDILGYSKMLAAESNISLPEGYLENIAMGPFFKEVAIRAYYLVAKMLLDPDREIYFQQLKQLLEQKSSAFSKEELDVLYIHLINYCISTKINSGQHEYFNELFEIYKSLLEKEIIFKSDVLLPQDYKNIITIGLHVKAFDWVEKFIQNHTAKLPKDNQANALTYNLAKVYFHQQRYEKVIEQLREVEYKNPVYALGGKLMLLKTYYELDELNALDSLIDSYRAYLRRNKFISREVRQQYLNVLRFVKKLSTIPPRDSSQLEKTCQRILNCKAIAAKQWLLEKVAERR